MLKFRGKSGKCLYTSVIMGALVAFTPTLAKAAKVEVRDGAVYLDGKKMGTGAILPTEKELKAMPRVERVRPNSLGLKRIDAERAKKGKAPLRDRIKPAAPGTETVLYGTGSSSTSSTSQELQTEIAASLPGTVDNTLLPSFPPIGNQGSEGSCVSFSLGYYVTSHNVGLLAGYNNKTSNANICSAEYVYNKVNMGGCTSGSAFTTNAEFIMKEGCANIVDVPYSSSNGCTAWGGWPRQTWVNAYSQRILSYQTVKYDPNLGVANYVGNLKQVLNNGYVMSFSIGSWTTLFPSYVAAASDGGPAFAKPILGNTPLAGKFAGHAVYPQYASHAMTLVGYDDNAWVDINGNGVLDGDEGGVFKIANSWGAGHEYGGYSYVNQAYFAKSSTWAMLVIPRASQGPYQPILADVSIQSDEPQISGTFGISSLDQTVPSVSLPASENLGQRPIFDVTDLFMRTGMQASNRFHFNLKDGAAGNGLAPRLDVLNVSDTKSGSTATAGRLPASASDGGSVSASADLANSPARSFAAYCDQTMTYSSGSVTESPMYFVQLYDGQKSKFTLTIKNPDDPRCPINNFKVFTWVTPSGGSYSSTPLPGFGIVGMEQSLSLAPGATGNITIEVYPTGSVALDPTTKYLLRYHILSNSLLKDTAVYSDFVYLEYKGTNPSPTPTTTTTPTPVPTVSSSPSPSPVISPSPSPVPVPSPTPSPSPTVRPCRGKKCS